MKTLACVAVTVEEAGQALRGAEAARDAGADLVEFRVDAWYERLGDEGGEAIKPVLRLVREAELPCIVTCRPDWEGGAYIGAEGPRAELFEALLLEPERPRYIDVEHDAFRRSPDLAARLRACKAGSTTGIIVSIHDFEGRPANLTRRLLDLRDLNLADVVKVAFRARSVRDNLELFELLRESHGPTIALGMGPFGTMSRVLAPKFGGFLTFASLRDETATAPGQPTASELLGKYRLRQIGRDTKVYGIIGWPVGHSKSPTIHNAGFEAIGFDGAYVPLPVASHDDAEDNFLSFRASVMALVEEKGLDFAGASVTLPHKENLVRLGVEMNWRVDDFARACGAANTLALLDGTWRVTNTDAPAAMDLLQRELGALSGRRVLVLGAGGVARGIALEAARRGASVRVWNRNAPRAERLVSEVRQAAWALGAGEIEISVVKPGAIGPAEALVHCTPAGMLGGEAEGELPIAEEAIRDIEGLMVVQDTVYNPPETPLLKLARNLRRTTLDGVEMFVAQAAAQFAMWTGRAAPVSLFERIVREELEGS
ncbi:MAG: type I 3-dehydroquinate dehydratase [Phycisphaerales bacterium]|nr:type I 3-dehydroquinate dehydratase [Phycisphaerales bacterium]